MKKILTAALLLLATFIYAPAYAQDGAAKVGLKLYANSDAAVPGQVLHIAIEQTIAPGWHTYWINPGDSGEPMKINWALPQGYSASDLLWPAPDRVPYGPMVNFGYGDRAVMLSDITVPADAPVGGQLPIRGKVSVLVCDEICIPESHDISLDIPVAASASPVNADIFSEAASHIAQPVDWATTTEADATEVRVKIVLPPQNRFATGLEDIVWFPYEWGYIDNAADQSTTFDAASNTLILHQPRVTDRDLKNMESAAYLIRKGDDAVIVAGLIKATPGAVLAPDGITEIAPLDMPLLAIILFAFLGGIILNLMPCVFPVLSMKALHLVGLPKGERAHARHSGLMYMLGVITMFLVLGAALYAIRAGGEHLGWGFQLQNPAVVALLAWLLFAIGLNLAGAFDLSVAFGGEMLLAEKHHPLVTSFLTGVLATLVATPCTAPFMATALGAALVQPLPIAMLIFVCLGFGLALPYTLLCFVPVLQRLLPRPGLWMQTFRQVLAFPMFASAVWLVWVVSQQGGPQAIAWTLGGMVALAFAIWLLNRRPRTQIGRRLAMMSGLAVITASLISLALIVPIMNKEGDAVAAESANYEPFTTESLDAALDDGDTPVFVNMTASWCITCLVNERMTLNTDETRKLFADAEVTYLKGDWTNKDPAITDFLRRYGRSGVPLYVYFGAPDEQTGKRPAAKILPQILTTQIMRDAVK